MIEHIKSSYKALLKVFKENAYSTQALFSEDMSNLSSRITLGVIEKNIYLEYILAQLVKKKPANNIYIILKIGTYMLLFLNKIPDYAIVNECVNFVKSIKKSELAGFVNAILNKVDRREFKLPKETDKNYLSVTYCKPQWFIDRMIKEFGEESTLRVLKDQNETFDLEHIRLDPRVDNEETLMKLTTSGAVVRKTIVGGYVVKNNATVKQLFQKGNLTFQSPSSMVAVQGLNPTNGSNILDICSAPGGKSVYMAQLCPDSTIESCDIYEHRLKLVQFYSKRMKVTNIETKAMDATILNPEFIDKFDNILVDAPCTCFGTFIKHPDVFMQHDESSIDKLSEIQLSILQNAIQYLKVGGHLVYSTCTLFKKENEEVVKKVLSSNVKLETMDIAIKNNGMIRILPEKEWEGFFVAKLVKEGE